MCSLIRYGRKCDAQGHVNWTVNYQPVIKSSEIDLAFFCSRLVNSSVTEARARNFFPTPSGSQRGAHKFDCLEEEELKLYFEFVSDAFILFYNNLNDQRKLEGNLPLKLLYICAFQYSFVCFQTLFAVYYIVLFYHFFLTISPVISSEYLLSFLSRISCSLEACLDLEVNGLLGFLHKSQKFTVRWKKRHYFLAPLLLYLSMQLRLLLRAKRICRA